MTSSAHGGQDAGPAAVGGGSAAWTVALPSQAAVQRRLLLLLFGLVVATGVGYLLIRGASAAEGLPWMCIAGIVMCLVAVFLELEPRPELTAVEGDPRASTITLVEQSGARLSLPRSAIAGAAFSRGSSSGDGASSLPRFYLKKRDGGRLHLGQGSIDQVQRLTQQLEQLLAAIPAAPAAEAELVREAERRLAASPLVELNRSGGTDGYRGGSRPPLELAWPKPRRRVRLLSAPLFIAGWVAIVGDILFEVGVIPVVGAGLLAAVGAALVYRSAAKRREQLRVDHQHLLLNQDGGTAARGELPLTAIQAIDLTFEGPLTIRLVDLQAELRRIREQQGPQAASSVEAKLSRWAAFWAGGISLETSKLPLADRFDLETLLGAEVAWRTGRWPGDL